MNLKAIRKKIWFPRDDVQAPSIGTLCAWLNEGDESSQEPSPMIEMVKYRELLSVLPDKIVTNLEKARLAREGKVAMIKAGLGYEELLSGIVVDGTAIASSSAEAFLAPAIKFPANSLAIIGNLPGKHLHWKSRGRETTLTTAATLTFRFGSALTNVVSTTRWAQSGAITMDASGGTNNQWFCEGLAHLRAIGSAGSVFAQGDATVADQALTIANQRAQYMGSAGSATPAAVTVDTTVDQFISLSGQWSLATAYSIQTHMFIVEALN